MGKQKGEGGRSENRPSSSSLAASLLPGGVSGVGFGGYLGSSRVEPSSSSSEDSLPISNGAIAEAIRIWKSNFDKEFEGVEECPICYSIIHTTTTVFEDLDAKTASISFTLVAYTSGSQLLTNPCPLYQIPF